MPRELAARWLVAGLLGACPALANAVDETGIVLVDGEGRARTQAMCSMCHSLDYIVINSPFLDRMGWEKTVRKMVTVMGAPLTDDGVAAIVDYLASHYGDH